MHLLVPMRATLERLEKAIAQKNVPSIAAEASRLLAPIASIFVTPLPVGPGQQRQWDTYAGPVALAIRRLERLVDAAPNIAGLRAVPMEWDWLRELLAWASMLIDVRPGTVASPPAPERPAESAEDALSPVSHSGRIGDAG